MEAIAFTIQGVPPYGIIMNRFGSGDKVNPKHRQPEAEAKVCLYTLEDGTIYFPAENLHRALIAAASYHKIGRRSAVGPVSGGFILSPDALDFKGEWTVDSRGVVIQATKGRIMRYRPIFAQWEVSGVLSYDPELFPRDETVRDIFDTAGKLIGLGDYRPEHKGPHGRFIVSKWEDRPD